ncbi:SpoIIE family protein phosphatase [Streptomyces bottropensis]|uniref:SpoIIE family protein phosphatase n=1 Tax=Streptomyces bottropensis TaxID=42235 RepID=UPI0036A24B1C
MMERWHRQIRCHPFGPEHFVTAQMLQLDTTTGRVQWVNAGHPPPILVREHRVAQRLVAPTTLPVGLGGSEPRVSELGLAPGTESSASPTE